MNVGLDRQKLADKLLKGGLSPAGLALLAEEDRNTQWSDSNEGSKRTSFDGNGSNSRNRVPTFEDIDELDQRTSDTMNFLRIFLVTPNKVNRFIETIICCSNRVRSAIICCLLTYLCT